MAYKVHRRERAQDYPEDKLRKRDMGDNGYVK